MSNHYDEAELKRLCECVGWTLVPRSGRVWQVVDGGPAFVYVWGAEKVARRLADKLEQLAEETDQQDEAYRGHLRKVYGLLRLHWQNRVPSPIPTMLRTEAALLRAWADEQEAKPKCPVCAEILKYKNTLGELVTYCPVCQTFINPKPKVCGNCGNMTAHSRIKVDARGLCAECGAKVLAAEPTILEQLKEKRTWLKDEWDPHGQKMILDALVDLYERKE